MNRSLIISGSGGQGIISIGTILSTILMLEDFFVTLCSSYGAEMRGGAVNCEINLSDSEILSVQNDKVDCIVALNQTSLDKFINKIKENGTIIINSSLARVEKTRKDIKYILAPISEMAHKLGNIKMANSIALGILSGILGKFPPENVKKAYETVLKNKKDLIEKNLEAYSVGIDYARKGVV